MKDQEPCINLQRLLKRIEELGKIGALEGGGACRLALTDEDKKGRDLVVSWMKELGMCVRVDQIGNIFATRKGKNPGPAVMAGSHIDTVRTGGLYDGTLGVLAGLEVAAALNETNRQTEHDFTVAIFTNEEGARFSPDMMGSACFEGSLDVEAAYARIGIDGTSVRENLEHIGYVGDLPCGGAKPRAYVELHIEQGPVLEAEDLTIGCVTGVQGISWQEVSISGVSNHAGTTPLNLRADAGLAAAEVAVGVRRMAQQLGGNQLATVGSIHLFPDLINVIPSKATLSIDLRNTNEEALQQAEKRTQELLQDIAAMQGVTISSQTTARFAPVSFDHKMVALVQETAKNLGYRNRRMPSGAGHDAGLIAPGCPTAMIFTPSVRGLSHNVEEFTKPQDIEAGAKVLLGVLLKLLGTA